MKSLKMLILIVLPIVLILCFGGCEDPTSSKSENGGGGGGGGGGGTPCNPDPCSSSYCCVQIYSTQYVCCPRGYTYYCAGKCYQSAPSGNHSCWRCVTD